MLNTSIFSPSWDPFPMIHDPKLNAGQFDSFMDSYEENEGLISAESEFEFDFQEKFTYNTLLDCFKHDADLPISLNPSTLNSSDDESDMAWVNPSTLNSSADESSVNPLPFIPSVDAHYMDRSSLSSSADESSKTPVYSPYSDHSYIKIDSCDQPCQPSKEEKDVDVWYRDDELSPPEVAFPAARRRNARRSVRSVSIKKAASVVLKKTRMVSKKLPAKRIKIENSVETTPSTSDYEDSVKSQSRGAKCKAIRAINRNNSNTTKAVKSEVQRTNHNRNEKKRREILVSLVSDVRDLLPTHYFKEKANRTRENPSKQKVLTACELYCAYLLDVERRLKDEKKKLKKVLHKNLKKKEQFLRILTSTQRQK